MDKVLNFIKRYRKFFALYLVNLFVVFYYVFFIIGNADGTYWASRSAGEKINAMMYEEWFLILTFSPLLLFVLYLAFKPIKK